MRRAARSGAASQLIRALVARFALAEDRISIGRVHSVDWQSLTFVGERHEISVRIAGPGSTAALAGFKHGLAEVEWRLAGHVVADLVIVGEQAASDGSIVVEVEALTLAD